ncbi:MAG: hypothetical protein ACK5M7_00460 [Draconibacterium sp.]
MSFFKQILPALSNKPILTYCFVLAVTVQSVWAQNTEEHTLFKLSGKTQSQMKEWFSECDVADPELPNSVQKIDALSKEQAIEAGDLVWKSYREGIIKAGEEKLLPAPEFFTEGDTGFVPMKRELNLGEKTMPFYFVGKGNVPEEKRPLFISLHGGGQDKSHPGQAHASRFNNREWATQLILFQKIFPDNALYFIPRMADDHDGRWYFDYCQDAYNTVIRQAILFHNVDPDRVFLIGISEGAYTAYRLGSFMADRLAGSNSMAGGEPLKNAPPANMRNIAFRADIGEFDTMFDRLNLNTRFADSLEVLHQLDPEGYNYHLEIQKGRGHGIEYGSGPAWIYQFSRNPYPQRVVWDVIKVHGRYKTQFYWVSLPSEPATFPLHINAKIDRENNHVYLKIEKEIDGKCVPTEDIPVKIYLNDQLADLDKPVYVSVNDGKKLKYKVNRSLATMMHSLQERGDPRYMFPAEILISRTE